MQKIKLIFANRKKIKEAASGCHYGSHQREIALKDDWIYEVSKGPLFTIGFTLRHMGLVNTFEEE